MLITTGVALVTLAGLLWWVLKPSPYWDKLSKIPGPKPVPLFGNSLQLIGSSQAFVKQIAGFCDKYSPIFKILYGTQPLIYVYKVKYAEQLLGSMKNLGKSKFYRFVEPWLQTGLLTSKGEKWHSRRKLLTPAFHFRILKDFIAVFNEHAEVLVELLEKHCDQGVVDVYPYLTLCALDIICDTAMGKKIHAQTKGRNSEYVNAVYTMSELVMQRFRYPWQWNDFIYNKTSTGKKHAKCLQTLHGFTYKVIDERRKELEESPEYFVPEESTYNEDSHTTKRRMAFLNLLLHMAEEANFSNHDIQEEVDTFMFEGHDTTTAGMSWTIFLLATHQEVQTKVREELDAIFGTSDRYPNSDDLARMKYMECVIKESHRLLPPVPVVGRYIEEDLEIGGLEIPRGVSIAIQIWRIHKDPTHWPDPDMFNPDRFTTENCVGRNPYAYIPFSAGPRNCIGQRFALNEEKCILSAILRKYHLESTQTLEDTQPLRSLILRPQNGIKIKITKREF